MLLCKKTCFVTYILHGNLVNKNNFSRKHIPFKPDYNLPRNAVHTQKIMFTLEYLLNKNENCFFREKVSLMKVGFNKWKKT